MSGPSQKPPRDMHKELKIAVLIRRFITTGGAEKYAVEVTKRLAKSHDVHVFAQEWTSFPQSHITFHRIPRPLSRPNFINQLFFSFFTRRIIDPSFDIIHSHERVTRFDVLTVHCPCYRGFITEQKNQWGKIKAWISVCTSPRHMAYLWLERKQFSYKKNRRFIAVSDKVKKDVQRNYPLPDDYFHLAYPGVDMDQYNSERAKQWRIQQRSRLGISDDEMVILFVGTEFKRKGLDTLLTAYTHLPKHKTRLVIAGGGDSKRYTARAQALGVLDRVTFLGLVSDMGPIYAMSDVYVLPTLSDPYAMAPIEAMVFNVPTITSCPKFAGSSENIRHGEALLINNPQDPEEIAKAMVYLMDKEHRNRLGRKGRNLAKNLTWDNTTTATLKTYHEIMAL